MSEPGSDDPEAEPSSAAFLAALADPARPPLPQRAAVVVAHPDDESIGCGAQLARFSDVQVVHVTDGAPRDGVDARRLGFDSPADYAAGRRAELEAAMSLAGIAPDRLRSLGWPDQETPANLPALTRSLVDILEDRQVVLTHAYEGGHADHDAAALAVRAACALLRRAGTAAPDIIEMPLYRAGPEGILAQSFAPADVPVTVIRLDWAEQQLKQAMYAAHGSQHDVLLLFRVDMEWFRPAPRCDFRELPNGGSVYYDGRPWGMKSAGWLTLAATALAELALEPVL